MGNADIIELIASALSDYPFTGGTASVWISGILARK